MQNRTKQTAPGVYYLEPRSLVTELKECDTLLAAASEPALRGKSRLCMHLDASSSFHEMIIVHERSAYVRPHRHIGKEESIHVIEGYADFIVFNEEGRVASVTKIGPYTSKRCWYVRINTSVFHTLIVRSKRIIFHEATTGPFNPAQTELAEWSPDVSDVAGQKKYLRELQQQVKQCAEAVRSTSSL